MKTLNASWMTSSLHPAFRFDDPSKNCETELLTHKLMGGLDGTIDLNHPYKNMHTYREYYKQRSTTYSKQTMCWMFSTLLRCAL